MSDSTWTIDVTLEDRVLKELATSPEPSGTPRASERQRTARPRRKIAHKLHKCGNCGEPGHNQRRCPVLTDWTRLVGTMPDTELARRLGFTSANVRNARLKAGIPPYKPEPAFAQRLGQEPDAEIARDVGLSVSAVWQTRRKLGIEAHREDRGSRGFEHRLGVEPDAEIARDVGLSRERIRQIRSALSIPSAPNPQRRATLTGRRNRARILRYGMNRTAREIGAELGLNHKTVGKHRRAGGVFGQPAPLMALVLRALRSGPEPRRVLARAAVEAGFSADSVCMTLWKLRRRGLVLLENGAYRLTSDGEKVVLDQIEAGAAPSLLELVALLRATLADGARTLGELRRIGADGGFADDEVQAALLENPQIFERVLHGPWKKWGLVAS